MLSTCFYPVLYRFSILFELVPTSRVLLGEENEALLHLAGQSIDFFDDFGFVLGSNLEPLGCPLGTSFNTWDPTVSICRRFFLDLW